MTQAEVHVSGTSSSGINVLSIMTLGSGLLGLAIVPIICGHISLRQIRRTGESGKLMATSSWYLMLLIYAAVFVFFIVMATANPPYMD